MEIYIVKQGDSIYRIAQEYGISPVRLAYDNQISGQEYLAVGQALLILFPETVHTVSAGETLEQIAREYQVTEQQLYRNNPFLLDRNYLLAGQQIVIDYEAAEEERSFMEVTGYAYPFVPGYIIREALLYINELLIFSYGFTLEGELVEPISKEDWLIREAVRFQTKPILVLTPFSETGEFNNYLVKAVSENLEMQQVLIENLLAKVKEKGYAGIDVDFEFILPEDREGYARFVASLREVMNANGYTVSVALAPKISAEQRGLLYEGVDYRLLGEAADSVFLMTYEWGYTYGHTGYM